MYGHALTLEGFVSPNENLPVFRDDKRLTKGSLLLIDFSHPSMGNTIPANNSYVKNLAGVEAKALLNTTDDTKVNPRVVNTITQTGGLMELTSKKGLHGIISQVNDVNVGNEYQFIVPLEMYNYIATNISHGFMVSVWDKKTRLATQPIGADFVLGISNTANYISTMQTGGADAIGKNLGQYGNANTLNSTNIECNIVGFSQATGTPTNAEFGRMYKFGSGSVYSSYELNKANSKVLYTIHIMDLQVAGLTFEQAKEKELIFFNEAKSGRFANDTFTSPSALA